MKTSILNKSKSSVLLLAFILFSFMQLYSQVKRESMLSEQGVPLTIEYARSVNLDKNDTLIYFYVGFQNAEYKTITDIKSVMIGTRTDFESFYKDLINAYKLIVSGERTNMSWNRTPKYIIDVYDFDKGRIYLRTAKQPEGYTIINKKELERLLSLMSQVDFGKTQLLPKKEIKDLIQ